MQVPIKIEKIPREQAVKLGLPLQFFTCSFETFRHIPRYIGTDSIDDGQKI